MKRAWILRFAAVAMALSLTAAPARADTTDELVADCKELLKVVATAQRGNQAAAQKQLSHASGVCWGYVDAIFAAFDFQAGDGAGMLGICKSKEFERGELITLFLDYVVRHPDAREHRPAFVFYWAAFEKYACKP